MTDDDEDLGECPRCRELVPAGEDCAGKECVAFLEWAMQHQDDDEGETL